MFRQLERVYKVDDVAKNLDIGSSTLRKWMAALQDAGYPWTLDEHGWRMIMEQDLISLRKMQECLASGMGMEQAAREIVDNYRPNRREGTSLAREEGSNEELVEVVKYLVQEIRDMKEKDRERDKLLLEAIRLLQETKQLAAAAEEKMSIHNQLAAPTEERTSEPEQPVVALEETRATEEPKRKKRGFWGLFKK